MPFTYKFLFTFFLIFITIYIFEYQNIDLLIQNNFYNTITQTWILDKNNDLLLKYFFYDGAKAFIILIASISLAIIILSFFSIKYLNYRKKAIIIILGLALTPAVVGLLKKSTNIACPNQLTIYNGTKDYIKIFDKKLKNMKDCNCFPAGHASGGFALIILSILGRTKKEEYKILYITICFGFIIGFYKMLIGDHFLSHTIVSMLIAFIIKDILFHYLKGKNENIINRR